MFSKYACTYCQEEISGLRVKCSDCENFILCLQCFSNGAEIGPHKNNHPYQFVNAGTLAIVSKSGWTASEELSLLDAIENYGYGNWEDISSHIDSRTPEEAKEEYINRFLESSIGRVIWEPAYDLRPHLTDLTIPDDGPLGPASMAKLPPLDITTEEATLLGYMPQRDDFEKEYDNTAELLVSSLSINPAEDDELDIALKLAQVDMYMNSLRERTRRKRVVKDYQLVSQFFASRRERPPKKKLTRDQKEFEDKFRPLCQFMTATEHDQLLSSLHREHDLRRRIKELLRYRNNGLTTLDECVQFSHLMVARQNYKAADSGNSAQTFHPCQLIKRRERKRNSSSIIKKITYSTEHLPTSQHSTDVLRCLNPNYNAASPASNMLSSSEIELCSIHELYPMQYISLKTLLLTKGVNEIERAQDIIQSVSSYLVSNGWITSV
ncbi:transcriptional adapter 2B-like isoform X2 [Planococcus citri]|uniref:transcriptional adapter 2B-like isoform X2 n=1 Tax=Planococcus citri TaxID=170843 RepID=UPI0031F83DF8